MRVPVVGSPGRWTATPWSGWAAELVGTGLQLFGAFTLIGVLRSPDSPVAATITSTPLRLTLIGLGIGTLAALVALSPLGRRSGAQLNPAISLAFWARGVLSTRDLVGHVVGQCLGATLAAAAFVATSGSWATTTDTARTQPAPGLGPGTVLVVEALITAVLVLAVVGTASSPRTARWTPAVVPVALAVLVPVGGPPTGASMNPARTLGPDLVSGSLSTTWLYVLGPVLGALLAVTVARTASVLPARARRRRRRGRPVFVAPSEER